MMSLIKSLNGFAKVPNKSTNCCQICLPELDMTPAIDSKRPRQASSILPRPPSVRSFSLECISENLLVESLRILLAKPPILSFAFPQRPAILSRQLPL